MTETATRPGGFDDLRAGESMEYMTTFGPVDPQLGLFGDASTTEQLFSTAGGQYSLSAPAWDHFGPLDMSMRSVSTVDHAAVDSATPADSTASSESTPSDSSITFKPAPVSPKTTSRRSTRAKPTLPKDSTKSTTSATSATSTASTSTTAASPTDPKAKRSQSLKRNRIAASKCRQKKKVWQHALEEQKGDLEAQHVLLQREYNDLLSEASHMKNLLMLHATCHDDRIDGWIENEAMRFVGRARMRTESSASSAGLGRVPRSAYAGTMGTAAKAPAGPTGLPSPPEPRIKAERFNFDHMPDDMFLEEMLEA